MAPPIEVSHGFPPLPQPPQGGEGEGHSVDPAQVRRLRLFLDWITPIILIGSVFDTYLGVRFHSLASLVLAGILVVVAGVLVAARGALNRGALDRAAFLTALTVASSAALIVFTRPHLYPVLVLGAVMSAAVALPFIHGQSLRRLLVVDWFVGAFVIVVGVLLTPMGAGPLPQVGMRVSLALALSILLALVLLMLGQYSSRLHDVLERLEGERDRATGMSAELAVANRAKTDFMNQAAHEINTPLTPIRIQLHLLRQRVGAVDEPTKQSVEILHRNIERLTSLVQDLLDASRLQNGKMKLQIKPHKVPDLVHEAVETFQESARQAGVLLVEDKVPRVAIPADARRISQVLHNLVFNAIKFTPPGGHISVGAARDHGAVRFVVHDEGVGLRAEDIPKLFHPFTQVDSAAATPSAGSGLGLYIAKGIVEAHGGHIWAQSAGAGQGSTFAFELPGKVAA